MSYQAPLYEDTPIRRNQFGQIIYLAPIAGGEGEEEPTPTNEDTPDVPWQKRYEDLRPEFDRTTAALKDEQKVWDDEDAVKARLAEKFGWQLQDVEEELEVDDDPDFADDDEIPLTKAEFAAYQAQQEAKTQQAESAREFAADLKRFVGDRELSEQGNAWIGKQAAEGKIAKPEDLEKAVNAYFEWEDDLGKKYFDDIKKSKRAPHVPAGGKTATGTKAVEDMNREEHTAWMVERALAAEHQ